MLPRGQELTPAQVRRRRPAPPEPASLRHISVLMPCYNEERTVGAVLARVLAVDVAPLTKEIIVVDDGSSDATLLEAERVARCTPHVHVLRHATNRGKGAAIRTALAAATGEACLIQDADLEYFVDDYRALLRPMMAGADVVYGSRFLTRRWPAGMQAPNFIANKLLTLAANLLFDSRLTDEATCFKLFRTKLLRELALEAERFEFCPEVTAKVGLRGIPIVEVPIEYRARNQRDGKKIRWSDGLTALATLLKHWWRGRSSHHR